MDIPVFVINLNRSEERRNYTSAQLNNLEISFNLIEAIDGKELPDDEVINSEKYRKFRSGLYSRYLRKEEVGCSLSHFKIYKQMLEDNIPIACILEDDNEYLPTFREILSELNSRDTDWDILYLGHRSGDTPKEAKTVNKERLNQLNAFVADALELPHGTHGYIISKKAAGILLENAFPLNVPFDLFLGNSNSMGLKMKLLTPVCIQTNATFVSTIQDEHTIVPASWLSNYVRNNIKKNKKLLILLKTLWRCLRITKESILIYLRRIKLIRNKYAYS